MASNPFNALMDPQQLGASIQNAFQFGTQQRQQMETQRALGQYAQNQSPETAAGVMRHNPMLGMQLQDREAERAAQIAAQQEAAMQADLQRRAAAGDKAALAELAGIDISAWNTLNSAQKAAFEQNIDFLGNAALQVSQLPEANRPAAWDSYIQQGVRMGMADLAQYAGQYSPDALNAVLAHAGQTKTFLDMERPSYQVVPFDATLVNTRDPAAVQQFQGGAPMGAQPSAPANPQVPDIIRRATASRVITPEEAQAVQAELGPNGQAAFQGWLQQNGVRIGKQVNGQTFYLVNGKWYDNPEGR